MELLDIMAWELLDESLSAQIVQCYFDQRYSPNRSRAILNGFHSDGIDPVELFKWDTVVSAMKYVQNPSILAMHLTLRAGISLPSQKSLDRAEIDRYNRL